MSSILNRLSKSLRGMLSESLAESSDVGGVNSSRLRRLLGDNGGRENLVKRGLGLNSTEDYLINNRDLRTFHGKPTLSQNMLKHAQDSKMREFNGISKALGNELKSTINEFTGDDTVTMLRNARVSTPNVKAFSDSAQPLYDMFDDYLKYGDLAGRKISSSDFRKIFRDINIDDLGKRAEYKELDNLLRKGFNGDLSLDEANQIYRYTRDLGLKGANSRNLADQSFAKILRGMDGKTGSKGLRDLIDKSLGGLESSFGVQKRLVDTLNEMKADPRLIKAVSEADPSKINASSIRNVMRPYIQAGDISQQMAIGKGLGGTGSGSEIGSLARIAQRFIDKPIGAINARGAKMGVTHKDLLKSGLMGGAGLAVLSRLTGGGGQINTVGTGGGGGKNVGDNSGFGQGSGGVDPYSIMSGQGGGRKMNEVDMLLNGGGSMLDGLMSGQGSGRNIGGYSEDDIINLYIEGLMSGNSHMVETAGSMLSLLDSKLKRDEGYSGGGERVKLTAGQQNTVNDLKSASRLLEDMGQLYNKAGGAGGLIGGTVKGALGGVMNQDVRAYNSMRASAGTAIAKAIMGNMGMTEADAKRYERMLPDWSDSIDVAEAKMETIRRELELKAQDVFNTASGGTLGGDYGYVQ